MTDMTARPPDPVIRASDAERDQAVALLQRHFAEGRLTQEELEQRVGEAYAARTREQLHALTQDLPASISAAPRQTAGPDPGLLCLLLCLCPPAGVVYWLLSRRTPGRLRVRAGGLTQQREPSSALLRKLRDC